MGRFGLYLLLAPVFAGLTALPSTSRAQQVSLPRMPRGAPAQQAAAVEGQSAFRFGYVDIPWAPNTCPLGIRHSSTPSNMQLVGEYGSPSQLAFGNGFVLDVHGSTPASVKESVETVNFPSAAGQGFVAGVTAGGVIVGGYFDTSNHVHGYELDNGIFTTFNVPFSSAVETIPGGVNDAGVTVGGWDSGSVAIHGFVREAGVYTSFDVPGAIQTEANAINDKGDIVGFFDNAGSNTSFGFLRSGATYTTIAVPGATTTFAEGVNGTGEIVGEFCTTAQCVIDGSDAHGFVWNNGVFTTIDIPGATATAASGISDDGIIVGCYATETGASPTSHGFTAVP